MVFRKYRLPKTWLDKCLKSHVSEDPQRDNAENVSKHCCNLNGSTFIYLLITLKVVALQEVSFSETQNLKTVC